MSHTIEDLAQKHPTWHSCNIEMLAFSYSQFGIFEGTVNEAMLSVPCKKCSCPIGEHKFNFEKAGFECPPKSVEIPVVFSEAFKE